MATFLFDKIIFGPVKSRRLGVSLGINLLPTESKVCNYDCVYCECGWTELDKKKGTGLPTRLEVRDSLADRLSEMAAKSEYPDVITFAGNGEPTMHPDFEEIINDTLKLRDELCPAARVAVLSNATLIHKATVSRALEKIDQNILKLDTVDEKSFRVINKASGGISLKKLIQNLIDFRGKMIIQTLFLKGDVNGEQIDNSSELELSGLISVYKMIQPEKIMIYTFERDTPASGLHKISVSELHKIAKRLENEGFVVEVSG
jgi:wyosine [tRNA(Phe)-imidazoG37] synthetase (radical SAM superfamily)